MGRLRLPEPRHLPGQALPRYRVSISTRTPLGLCRDEIVTNVRNGIQASLMTPSEKAEAFAQINDILATIA